MQAQMINFNQLPSDFGSPVISSVEWSQKPRKQLAKHYSTQHNDKIRQKWYNTYSMPEKFVDTLDFRPATSSSKPGKNNALLGIKARQGAYLTSKPKIGDSVSSIVAMSHIPGDFGVDIRPKVFDNITNR